jgi:hypothetical protein
MSPGKLLIGQISTVMAKQVCLLPGGERPLGGSKCKGSMWGRGMAHLDGRPGAAGGSHPGLKPGETWGCPHSDRAERDLASCMREGATHP